jgi:peptidoglycan/xylan/chitin deacetylase (PgdA/CDA1 family)
MRTVNTFSPRRPRAGTRGIARLAGAMREARPQKARTVVLCYHSIGAGDSPLTLPAEVFRAQVELLAEEGFDFVSFGKLADILARGSLPARPTAVLTFDDGFADMHTVVWPSLTELRIPATCFVTTGLMQGEPSVLARFAGPAGSSNERFLGPTQVAELASAGCEIGAHTHTHRNLMHLDAEEATEELRRSRAILEEITRAAVRVLAYPFGKYGVHFTDRTVQVARDLGFAGAAAVANRGVGHRDRGRTLRLPRFTPVREDPAWFKRRMLGDLDWVCWIRDRGWRPPRGHRAPNA